MYVINTIVNCTLKAGLLDSAHHVTGILFTTDKLPIVLYIIPSINIRGNTTANYGDCQTDCNTESGRTLEGFLLGLKAESVFGLS